MSDMSEEYKNVQTNSSPTWHLPAIVILALLALSGLGWAWNNSNKLDATKQAFMDQVKSVQTGVQQDVTSLKDRIAQDEKVNTDLQGDLKVVTNKLKITQGQLKKARQEAADQITQTSDKITALDTSVHSELATKATSDDVKTVDTKVTAVSSNLDKTISDLNMAKSELGTLIARNHDEIDELRRVGERDYAEFTLTGKGTRSKVGDLMVELRGTNVKKNQFSVALYVDDLRLEKKDRAIDEPIYFYSMGTRVPRELVVNQIGKDKIVGYLSVPKGHPKSASTGRTAN
jgi:chromosome segregation ATPase